MDLDFLRLNRHNLAIPPIVNLIQAIHVLADSEILGPIQVRLDVFFVLRFLELSVALVDG